MAGATTIGIGRHICALCDKTPASPRALRDLIFGPLSTPSKKCVHFQLKVRALSIKSACTFNHKVRALFFVVSRRPALLTA